eukprot:4891134-Pleurochrysis_carterae.AAC.1
MQARSACTEPSQVLVRSMSSLPKEYRYLRCLHAAERYHCCCLQRTIVAMSGVASDIARSLASPPLSLAAWRRLRRLWQLGVTSVVDGSYSAASVAVSSRTSTLASSQYCTVSSSPPQTKGRQRLALRLQDVKSCVAVVAHLLL